MAIKRLRSRISYRKNNRKSTRKSTSKVSSKSLKKKGKKSVRKNTKTKRKTRGGAKRKQSNKNNKPPPKRSKKSPPATNKKRKPASKKSTPAVSDNDAAAPAQNRQVNQNMVRPISPLIPNNKQQQTVKLIPRPNQMNPSNPSNQRLRVVVEDNPNNNQQQTVELIPRPNQMNTSNPSNPSNQRLRVVVEEPPNFQGPENEPEPDYAKELRKALEDISKKNNLGKNNLTYIYFVFMFILIIYSDKHSVENIQNIQNAFNVFFNEGGIIATDLIVQVDALLPVLNEIAKQGSVAISWFMNNTGAFGINIATVTISTLINPFIEAFKAFTTANTPLALGLTGVMLPRLMTEIIKYFPLITTHIIELGSQTRGRINNNAKDFVEYFTKFYNEYLKDILSKVIPFVSYGFIRLIFAPITTPLSYLHQIILYINLYQNENVNTFANQSAQLRVSSENLTTLINIREGLRINIFEPIKNNIDRLTTTREKTSSLLFRRERIVTNRLDEEQSNSGSSIGTMGDEEVFFDTQSQNGFESGEDSSRRGSINLETDKPVELPKYKK